VPVELVQLAQLTVAVAAVLVSHPLHRKIGALLEMVTPLSSRSSSAIDPVVIVATFGAMTTLFKS
jgi:hypothetical protein